MTNNSAGGKKGKQSMMKQNNWTEEEYTQYMREMGRMGGMKRVPKGFSTRTHEERVELGRRGGNKTKQLNSHTQEEEDV